MWFDTHCHLDPGHCPEGAAAILARARAADVPYLVCIGVGGEAAQRNALALAASDPGIWATVGVHPHDAAELDAEGRRALEEMVTHERVVALGEVGLDYHYDHSPRELQREVFAQMIALGRRIKKPLVIHTRSAAADTLELLSSEGAREIGGIIHCFSEDREFAARALELGFYLSFSGIVTFKKALPIQDVARWAPADRVLVETDSPYLAPVPLRGRPCEPAFIVHTAEFIAKLRGIPVSEFSAITTANAARCFGIQL
jgi:TatD DNase family protein